MGGFVLGFSLFCCGLFDGWFCVWIDCFGVLMFTIYDVGLLVACLFLGACFCYCLIVCYYCLVSDLFLFGIVYYLWFAIGFIIVLLNDLYILFE